MAPADPTNGTGRDGRAICLIPVSRLTVSATRKQAGSVREPAVVAFIERRGRSPAGKA
ncbi:hypothetical protein IE4872_PB00145 (plasmid) [Rhizobium gallicum]|uniref:Uncharacterized protein n=2 Tax=Rhizobium gallicum TaxID=56730 RepID=A0A0B4XA87_9HYPH|nr:hypothetical protein RGR602_PA00179 [Rhizobium gallicum bv. gallicum R602sp]APO70015.1 hypothetical protein IE4872_PB00145 [Rhizobium gallicum]